MRSLVLSVEISEMVKEKKRPIRKNTREKRNLDKRDVDIDLDTKYHKEI